MITVQKISQHNKLNALITVLAEIDNETYREGTIIFVNENRTADSLVESISEFVCPATFHGARSQSQVVDALQQFESGDTPILIATSVDRNVRCAHVINFDVPIREEEYKLRIFRKNRIGNKPNVITFYDETSFESLGQVFNRIIAASNN